VAVTEPPEEPVEDVAVAVAVELGATYAQFVRSTPDVLAAAEHCSSAMAWVGRKFGPQ
jgi:hypothetical protein